MAITEFGCAAFRGAADLAGRELSDVIEWDDSARPVRLKGEHTRDEGEQARHLGELLDVYHTEGVDAAFVYTFARYDLADRSASHEDFDMASAGLVRVLDEGRHGQLYPDMPWEPKAAFTALAEYYRALDRQPTIAPALRSWTVSPKGHSLTARPRARFELIPRWGFSLTRQVVPHFSIRRD